MIGINLTYCECKVFLGIQLTGVGCGDPVGRASTEWEQFV